MGFIGVQPASVPLTADDVPDLPATKITSGTFPALNGSNLTSLPAGNLTGTLPAISGANLTGISAGIVMMDAWYITSTQTHSSGEQLFNAWSRMSNESAKKMTNIGSAMSQSSGIFTFPATGKYWVMFKTYCNGNSTTNYAGIRIKNNDNNSIASSYANRNNSNDEHAHVMAMTFIDVDDVTDDTCKLKFTSNQGNTSTWVSGGEMETKAFFIRMGDT